MENLYMGLGIMVAAIGFGLGLFIFGVGITFHHSDKTFAEFFLDRKRKRR